MTPNNINYINIGRKQPLTLTDIIKEAAQHTLDAAANLVEASIPHGQDDYDYIEEILTPYFKKALTLIEKETNND